MNKAAALVSLCVCVCVGGGGGGGSVGMQDSGSINNLCTYTFLCCGISKLLMFAVFASLPSVNDPSLLCTSTTHKHAHTHTHTRPPVHTHTHTHRLRNCDDDHTS